MSRHRYDTRSQRRRLNLETTKKTNEPLKVTNAFPATWSRIPADLLVQILRLGGSRSNSCLRLVCKTWRKSLDSNTVHLVPRSCMSPYWVRLPRIFQNLRSLDLVHVSADLNDGLLIVINSLPSLKSLRLTGCEHVSCMGLYNCMLELTQLQELDLSGCQNIMEEGLVHVALMDGLQRMGRPRKGLTALNISHCGLTEDNCTILGAMTALRRLHLDGCPTTSVGLKKLNALVQVELLSLVQCELKDDAVEKLAVFTRLRSLDLSKNHDLQGTSLGALSRELSELSELRLQQCRNLDNDALSKVHCFHRLSFLSLRGCESIGDVALENLGKRKTMSLTMLDLDECHLLTNHGLEELSELESVRVVSLRGCGRVTRPGVDCLLKAGKEVHAEGIGSMLANQGD